ncbi:MAG TPA: Smr/MutS family protein [Candidatus Latescibacteria bacterium]|nr:Smr/MutS family protein [Candidatus Latescibacterota bacterium]
MRKVVKARPQPENLPSDGAKALFLETVRALRPEDIPVKPVDRDDGAASKPVARRRIERVTGSIDLHGMTAEQAIRYLTEVLPDYRRKGGTVEIVVGKGLHSPDGKGVLREVVSGWLDHAGRRFVSRWRWGGRRQGGNGVIVAAIRVPVKRD